MDGLADGADRLGEILDPVRVGHVASLEMHLRHAQVVAGDEAVENFGEETPLLQSKPAHDAEIDRHEAALAVAEQVALMHVGVKEAVAHGVAQKRLDDDAPEVREVGAGLLQTVDIGQRNPVDPFERQHVLGGAVPIDAWHAEFRVARAVFGEFGRGRRLQPEIHFHPHRARQGVHDLDGAQAAGFGDVALGEAGGEIHVREVAREAGLDAGPQHLHRDIGYSFGGPRLGAVNLRDGGGGDRLAEFHEYLVEFFSERRFDNRHGHGAGKRRHLVLELFKLADRARTDDIGTRREKLAEFDVGGAEPRERRDEAAGTVARRRPGDQFGHRQQGTRGGRRERGIDLGEHAFARQHVAGAGQPQDVENRANRHGTRASSPSVWRPRRRSGG